MSWVDTLKVKGIINKDKKENKDVPEFDFEFEGVFDYDTSGVYEQFNYTISSKMHKVKLKFDTDYKNEVKIFKNNGEVEIYKLVKEKTLKATVDNIFEYESGKEEITGIKDEFSGFITDVIIPDGTKIIKMCGMENAKSIYIPESVEKIDVRYSNLKNLDKIVIDENNPYYCSYNSNVIVDKRNMTLIKASKNGIIPDGVKIIGESALAYNENKTIVIPNSVEVIDEEAFSYSIVENLILSENLIKIERNAFLMCKSLKDIVLPKTLKTIEAYAFYECMSLKNITIPDSCEYIGVDAFENCFSLENIILPSDLKIEGKIIYFGEGTEDPFGDNPIEHEYQIKGNMYNDGMYIASKTNPYYMLLMCECNNDIIEIHKDTKIISSDVLIDVLNRNANVKKIIIPKLIDTIIFDISFVNNDKCIIEYDGTKEDWNKINKNITPLGPLNKLESITLNIKCLDGMTELIIAKEKHQQVNNKSKIETTNVEDEKDKSEKGKILSITNDNISYYGSDKEVINRIKAELGDTITSVVIINETIVFIPANVEKINSYLFSRVFEKIVVDENNPYYGSYDSNVLVDKSRMILFLAAKHCKIPEGVKFIGNKAFANNNLDETIVIPSGVKAIGVNSFSNCSNLKKIIFPDTLTKIKSGAFSFCKSLKDFILPESLKEIEEGAFFECMSITNITIPDSCEHIGVDAFKNCFSLENIILPSKLKIDGKIIHFGKGKEYPYGANSINHEYKIKGNMYNDGMYLASKTNPYYMILRCECDNDIIEIHKDTKIVSSDVLIDVLNENSNVKKIIIPKLIDTIMFDIPFVGNECIIEYDGTKEEWEKIKKYIRPLNPSAKEENIITLNIQCLDGMRELKININ